MPYKDRETRLKYYKKWYASRREGVIKALGGKCFLCGSIDNLEIHHIFPLDVEGSRHNFWNNKEELMLLCESCHKTEHRKLI